MGKRSHLDFIESNGAPNLQDHEISEHTRRTKTDDSEKLDVSSDEVQTQPMGNDGSVLVSNLVHALNAVLNSEETLLRAGTLNRVALARCRALQPELPKPKREIFKTKGSEHVPNISLSNSSSEITPPQNIAPWIPSSIPSSLPDLPQVLSPALEKSAFTHSGVLPANAGPHDSYERLEWVGDAYIYLLTTLLISKTFPFLQPGRCAQLRERCLKNETLASYGRQYGFEKRCHVPKDFAEKAPQVKVLGDVFEAYVAAVIYSDPRSGIERASTWLKALWAGTLSKEILEQDDVNKKSQTGPLLPSTSAKQELAKLITSRGIKINYKDVGTPSKDPGTGFPLYTVGVYLNGWGERNKLLGTGTALGKKEAGAKAAEDALKRDLYVYKEKKRIFDEINRAKKEAEEAATNA